MNASPRHFALIPDQPVLFYPRNAERHAGKYIRCQSIQSLVLPGQGWHHWCRCSNKLTTVAAYADMK